MNSSLRVTCSSRKEPSYIENGDFSGKLKLVEIQNNYYRCLKAKFSTTGAYFGSAIQNGSINVFSIHKPKLIYTLTDKKAEALSGMQKYAATSLFFGKEEPYLETSCLTPLDPTSVQNGTVVGSYTDGGIRTFRLLSGAMTNEIMEENEILSMDAHPDAHIFGSGGATGTVSLYDSSTQKIQSRFTPSFQRQRNFDRINCIKFRGHGYAEFLIGKLDGGVEIFDSRCPLNSIASTNVSCISGEGIDFHRDGYQFCVAAFSRIASLSVFDIRNLSQRTVLYEMTQLPQGRNNPRLNFSKYLSECPSQNLFCCKYLEGCKGKTFIAVGGTEENAMFLIETANSLMKAAIRDLKFAVYSIDVISNSLIFCSGNELALLDFTKV